MAFCGCDEADAADFGAHDTHVLMLGLEGSGKTLLARRLAALHRKDKAASFTTDTLSTAGVELHQATCGKGAPLRKVTIRELGGQMIPIWPQYFQDCLMVAFVVDMANSSAVAQATAELYELLRDERLQDKPFAIVLSKTDLPLTLSRSELELVMNLAELERMDHVTVVETCATDESDAQKVLNWVLQNLPLKGDNPT